MNQDADQLSATFAAHEHLAPDADDVLARARGIARSYQRRRWAVRATGGAVLGAGLVVSGVALPRIGNASSNQTINTLPIAAGSSSSAPAATFTDAQGTSAYFAAGYDYNDAVQLEALWNDGKTPTQVKAEAGIKLLEGDTLPVQPSGTPESKADASVAAFFAAGYTYDDAVTLGNLWHDTNTYQVKGEAGRKLIDGQPLPIPPSGTPGTSPDVVTGSNAKASANAKAAKTVMARKAALNLVHVPMIQDPDESPALNAYFGGGYDYPNAVALGQLWNETDITQIKTEAGQKLLDGETLPVTPDNPPIAPENTKGDAARAAFFGAGYTYDDAVTLGNMWNNSNTYQVKAIAGQKLLDGQTLPIAP